MIDAEAVRASLGAAAEPFGASATPVELRWGELFEELDGRGDTGYASAVELIYEGYLLHYRESRACAPGAPREHSLLAGDFFYARGLRVIAARGDAAAVGLLARLMASCSYLRSIGAPFAEDDALWATAMGGLAALRGGASPAAAEHLFDRLDDAVARGESADAIALAHATAPGLGLREPAPVIAALDEAAAAADSLDPKAGATTPRSGARRQTWT